MTKIVGTVVEIGLVKVLGMGEKHRMVLDTGKDGSYEIYGSLSRVSRDVKSADIGDVVQVYGTEIAGRKVIKAFGYLNWSVAAHLSVALRKGDEPHKEV